MSHPLNALSFLPSLFVISHPLFVLASLVKQRDRVHFPFPNLQNPLPFSRNNNKQHHKNREISPILLPPGPKRPT